MKLALASTAEIEAASRDRVVLLPTGAIEQHGPHLPLGTDVLVVTAIAEAVEAALPDDVLLLPTQWLAVSDRHASFAGTLAAPFSLYAGTISAIFAGLIQQGFHRFFVLNGAASSDAPNEVILRELKARHPNCQFLHRRHTGASHAGEIETSLMLHLFPSLVSSGRTDDGLTSGPALEGLVTLIEEVSEHGVLGLAARASAETGRAEFERLVRESTESAKMLRSGVIFAAAESEDSRYR